MLRLFQNKSRRHWEKITAIATKNLNINSHFHKKNAILKLNLLSLYIFYTFLRIKKN